MAGKLGSFGKGGTGLAIATRGNRGFFGFGKLRFHFLK